MEGLEIFLNIAYTSRIPNVSYVEFERVYSPLPELLLFLQRVDDSLEGKIIGVPQEHLEGINIGDRVRVIYPYEDFPMSIVPIKLYPFETEYR